MPGHFHVWHRYCRAETGESLIVLSTHGMIIILSVIWKCLTFHQAKILHHQLEALLKMSSNL